VIFDLSLQYELDFTSTVGIAGLVRDLGGDRVDVFFVGVHATVLARDTTGLLAPIVEGNMYPTIDDAVRRVDAGGDAASASP
jgi:hypothetical protein